MARKSSKNGKFSRMTRWLVFFSIAALIIFNLLFLFRTSLEMGSFDPNRQNNAPLSSSAHDPVNMLKEKSASEGVQKYMEIEVLSSKKNVTHTINGKLRFDKSEMRLRGLNIVVLNEVTGAEMSSVWFDTYESSEDSQRLIDFLQGLRKGRILCFAVKDEAIGSLSQSARNFLASYGSAYIKQLKFRSMWAFVVQQMENGIIVYAESFQNPESGAGGWGNAVTIRTWVRLLSENVQTCRWEDSVENRRRIEFCEKFEGYGDVCNCENPLSLSFDPPALPDGSRVALPVAVMASNRPHYLLRMLRSLRDVHGLDPSMVTVFIDGFYEEPLSVSRMFGIGVEQHAGVSRLNSRICQHYKKSLTSSFDRFPNANYLVILEEDLEMSSDILSYFKQLLPVLENDESVYCISAWNDQGYDHLANDPAMMYRIETMPGLGWVLSRKLYKGELEAKWPKPDEMWDWDMWMRGPANRKGRECIIPDVSRTYHFGAKGLNVGGFMQAIYFQKHALNKVPNVKMDAEKMYKDNYEKEITRLLSAAEVLDHTKTPCANLKDFVPDTVDKLYVFYIRMDTSRDYTTWNNVARCFRMWDLDVRGFHHSMWRFWIKKNHILVVGCPASVYCSLKPDNVNPIHLPNKETRPRDDVR